MFAIYKTFPHFSILKIERIHFSSKQSWVFSTGLFTEWLRFYVNLKILNIFPFIEIVFDKCAEYIKTNSWEWKDFLSFPVALFPRPI